MHRTNTLLVILLTLAFSAASQLATAQSCPAGARPYSLCDTANPVGQGIDSTCVGGIYCSFAFWVAYRCDNYDCFGNYVNNSCPQKVYRDRGSCVFCSVSSICQSYGGCHGPSC